MTDTPSRRVRLWESLLAWQHAHKLFLAIHRATAKWPVQERYALGAQIRKALDVSLGSLAEVQYTLRAAHDLGIISPESWRDLDSLSDEAGRCLWGLYRSGPKGRAGS